MPKRFTDIYIKSVAICIQSFLSVLLLTLINWQIVMKSMNRSKLKETLKYVHLHVFLCFVFYFFVLI